MGYERIDDSSRFDGPIRESHVWRYLWANGYIKTDDVVLDCACGTGYARHILNGKYIGVDKLAGSDIVADLETWQPDFEFDVFVSIETIEHIHNYQNILDIAKKAKKYAIISTPIIPTKHRNEFHVQDFTFTELISFLPNFVASRKQDSGDGTIPEMYGIAVFQT